MDHREVFARRLNDLILRRGVQKQDCAAAIGVTKSAFSQFSTRKAVPSFDTLIPLADYLGVVHASIGGSCWPQKQKFYSLI